MIRWHATARSAREVVGLAALSRLERLMPAAVGGFDQFIRETRGVLRHHRARRDIAVAGQPQPEPVIVVAGWVSHHRVLQDGRRQIVALTLPGEILLPALRGAGDAIGAITDVTLMEGPVADSSADQVTHVYALNARLQQGYLLDHIVRLGRQVAYERMAHLLLELHGRLALADLTDGDGFPMPLTQETLADLLGLTSVHVNRTLQTLKGQHLIDVRRGVVTLLDRPALLRIADYHTPYHVRAPARSQERSIQQIQLI